MYCWLGVRKSMRPVKNKDPLSLTTPGMRCITANVLKIHIVNAQCDKLATELRQQRFASKVANFQLPHLHFPICIWRLRWG